MFGSNSQDKLRQRVESARLRARDRARRESHVSFNSVEDNNLEDPSGMGEELDRKVSLRDLMVSLEEVSCFK